MNRHQQDQQLNEWLHCHKGLLLKVAKSFAVCSHDRDDLLQEIVLQVWRSISGYTAEVKVSTWIYRVALYTAVSWSRKEAKREKTTHDVPHDPIDQVPAADPRIEWLYEKISELAPVDRSLALLMLDNFSYRDISQTLGISESNVGVRATRLRKQLTDKLQRDGKHEL